MLKQFLLTLVIVIGFGSVITSADEVAQKQASQVAPLNLAVTADFAPTAETIGKEFTTLTGVPVKITSDSSEALLQEIKKGTQFDVYMSANTNYPIDLERIKSFELKGERLEWWRNRISRVWNLRRPA